MAGRAETLGSGAIEKASFSSKAGLKFPVGIIRRNLKAGKYAKRITTSASVYLAAVLEYLAAEVLELAGNAARGDSKGYIVSRHIERAVKNDLLLGEVSGIMMDSINNGST